MWRGFLYAIFFSTAKIVARYLDDQTTDRPVSARRKKMRETSPVTTDEDKKKEAGSV